MGFRHHYHSLDQETIPPTRMEMESSASGELQHDIAVEIVAHHRMRRDVAKNLRREMPLHNYQKR